VIVNEDCIDKRSCALSPVGVHIHK